MLRLILRDRRVCAFDDRDRTRRAMSTTHGEPPHGAPTDPVPGTLWRNSDFLLFWAGQTISLFGSQVTYLALPLIAAGPLHAGPAQMALLTALGYAPAPIVGLFAGAWVDRLRRKPMMIWADLGRALLLLALPLAALMGQLRVELLYAVA